MLAIKTKDAAVSQGKQETRESLIFEHPISSVTAYVLTLTTPPRPILPGTTHTHHNRHHTCDWYDTAKMFDEDKSGKIDEDEFFFLLQYLGIEVGDG